MNEWTFVAWLILAVAILIFVFAWQTAANWLIQALLWIERRRSRLVDFRVQANDLNFHYVIDKRTAQLLQENSSDSTQGNSGDQSAVDNRPTLLLLHGFGGDVHHWLQVAPLLSKQFRLFIPDLPGFGDTPFPQGEAGNMEAQAERILGFMDAVGIESCIVAGNSMGAYLAAMLAHRHPQRVNALWLMNPGGVHGAEFTQLLSEAAEGNHRNALIPQDLESFRWLRSCVFVKQPFLPTPITKFIVKRCRQRRGLLEFLFNALCFESKPLDEFAHEIQCPTLLVWGDRDQVLHPSGADIVARLLPKGSSIMMKNVGHCPMLEVPQQSVADFVQFVNSSELRLTPSER